MSQLFFEYFPEIREQLVFTLHQNPAGGLLLSPALIPLHTGGKAGKLKDFIPPAEPPEDITNIERDLLNSCLKDDRGVAEFVPAAESFIKGQARLFSRRDKRPFEMVPCSYLSISLEFFQLKDGKILEFRPVFHVPEDPLRENFYRWQIFITGDSIMVLDIKRSRIFHSLATPEDRSVLTLMKHYVIQSPWGHLERLVPWKKKLSSPKLQVRPLPEKIEMKKPTPVTILKIRPGVTCCHVGFWFRYGDDEVSHIGGEELFYNTSTDGGRVVVLDKRNKEFETSIIDEIKEKFDSNLHKETGLYNRFVSGNSSYDIEISMGLHEFIIEYADMILDHDIELFIDEKRVIKAGDVTYNVKIKNDWLDVQMNFENSQDPLILDSELLEANVVETSNQFLILKQEDIQELLRLRKLGMDPMGHLKTSVDNLTVVDLIYQNTIEKENLLKQKKGLANRLKNLDHCPVDLPDKFNATLRPYQESGYQRLFFWHNFKLNGCLADDMGLGKTVQTLALLQRLYEEKQLRTCLLVAPVVTLPNWESEAERFVPDLSVHRHSGKTRLSSWKEIKEKNIILISYQTLRNDMEIFKDFPFYYIILDEAHYIKNASSQTFKVIRSLTAEHRLSLTGTPLENSTAELWSQMNFLNPWLLGTMKDFKKNFSYPIEKEGDENAADALKDVISPFLLRRRKEEVLDDLPPKEEIILKLEMPPEQKKAYERLKELYRERVKEILESEDPRQASVAILTFMLKLRQMALVPALVDKRFRTVPSCKLDSLDLLLEEILQEDHKVLIFTQFTSVLELIEQRMHRSLTPYVKLTGSTRDRAKPVKTFQEDPNIKVFLLSLKAGGVGINLTAADYVFLFDPWWNPSSEAQAVDRAHRMGQKRKVISYKLIAKGTIEEKILTLQERKKELADTLITDTKGSLSRLNQQEILNLFN